MKTGALIQARMGSSRLPGKVLKKLPWKSETSVLEQVISRVKASKMIDMVGVLTSILPEDNSIENLCKKLNIPCYRGSSEDVLDRYYHSSKQWNLDEIVRITADCPCLDSELIDRVISLRRNENADYASNCRIRSFPHGLDVEVITGRVLDYIWNNANLKRDREHVLSYIHLTHPEKFVIKDLVSEIDYSDIRITLDRWEDYLVICDVFYELGEKIFNLRCKDIVSLYEKKPWIFKINQNVIQKHEGLSFEEDIKQGIFMAKLQELKHSEKVLKDSLLAFQKKDQKIL